MASPSSKRSGARRTAVSALEAPLGGTLLVEASAGTGKTYTITTLFIRLVVENRLSAREIVVVTFTDAATAELRARIRRRLRIALDVFRGTAHDDDPEMTALAAASRARGDDEDCARRLTEALRELDLAAISTIHAFCLRALQERAFESGAPFGLELMTDTSLLVREVAEDFWAASTYPMADDLYGRLKNFSTQIASKLVDTFGRRPLDLPVLPSRTPPGPEASREQLRALYDKARSRWRSDGPRLRRLLAGASLYNSHCAEKTGQWCDELDVLLADVLLVEPTPTFVIAQPVVKLSRSALVAVTRVRQPTPTDALFETLQEIRELVAAVPGDLELGLKAGAVAYARKEMPLRKRALRAQAFEDLLFSLDVALEGTEGNALATALRSTFKAALIDEFQDTDPVQYRIFRKIFHGHATFLLVGDPKQSIYAFRGADVFSYFTAKKDAQDAAFSLAKNYRSDPSLVTAVNHVFDSTKDPFVYDSIEFHAVEAHAPRDRIDTKGALEILFLPRAAGDQGALNKGTLDDTVPALVAGEIVRFLTSGAKIEGAPVRAGDVAVLTRSNKQARDVQTALRNLGVATALESQASVFESPEAEELERVLQAVLAPTRQGSLKSALATSLVGESAEAIVALEQDERGWTAWSERFRRWQDEWAKHGFTRAYRRMLDELAAEKRLLALVDGERRTTNFLHLGELLHRAVTRDRHGATALVRWLGLKRQDVKTWENGRLGNETAELRLESDEHAVKLLTIHKSKGLEYPVVYAPFLWKMSADVSDPFLAFHDEADGFRLKIHLDPRDEIAKGAAERECRAENQRLLYVALTRAKHRCSIVWGCINQTTTCPLTQVLHPSREADAICKLTDAELRRDLAALAKGAKGTIVVRDLLPASVAPIPEYRDVEPADVELRARTFARRVDDWWRIGSFTGLVRGRTSMGAPEAAGRDRDEPDAAPAAEAQAPPDGVVPAPPLAAAPSPLVLDRFPRGAKPGTLIHAVLEHCDFMGDTAALDAIVKEQLAEAGYPDELGPTLVKGIETMLATPLDDRGLVLANVPREKRVDELEFVLPVAHSKNTQCTARAIADALTAHAGDVVPSWYPAQVAKLPFQPLRGFLRGFIDLVFEDGGRFYVVDYKSNHLGSRPEDYAREQLREAMGHSDYYLQYHLYVIAVHRWLSQRMRGYDFDEHFGGVLYLFVRGMAPAHALGTGVFFDRPSRALVDALSLAIDGGPLASAHMQSEAPHG